MRYQLLVACTLIAASPATAQLRPFTIGVTGGTLGVGPEVTYQFNPLLAVRGSATFLSVGASGNTSSYHYSGHAHLSNFGGTVDLHPFANGFRVSAGVRSIDHNRADFSGYARGNRVFSGVTFTPDQVGTISGEVRARSIAPIATIGYVKTTLIGLTLGLDAGVMFQGKPTAYNFTATGQLGTNPAAQAEFASQQRSIENDIDGYKYYPVAQLSIGYRF